MTPHGRVAVVGEFSLDVMLPSEGTKMRLGGVAHACRALWALGVEYEVAYSAPEFLVDAIRLFLTNHNAASSLRFGQIVGAPNTVLIREPTEAGSQGYEVLLRDEVRTVPNEEIRFSPAVDAVLILAGDFSVTAAVLAAGDVGASCHIDIANLGDYEAALESLPQQVMTLISSTSSRPFVEAFKGAPQTLVEHLLCFSERVLFKENRGGARLFVGSFHTVVSVGAQLRPIQHSVGVGDVFDAAFVAIAGSGNEAAMNAASWIAASYASTTYPDTFKQDVEAVISNPDVLGTAGVSLRWEDRDCFNVYLAGPDFDHLDRTAIESVVAALEYHNFAVRLPIRENGQIPDDADFATRTTAFTADLKLLSDCQMVLAVVPTPDPGTLVEIGLAVGLGKPVAVLDPHGVVRANLFAAMAPRLVTDSLDELISFTFDRAARMEQ